MPIENCKKLLYKRGPIVIAFAIGAVVATTGTILATGTSQARPTGVRAVQPAAFLPGLAGLPAAARHVQAHVRAVRRKHDPKPKTRSTSGRSRPASTCGRMSRTKPRTVSAR